MMHSFVLLGYFHVISAGNQVSKFGLNFGFDFWFQTSVLPDPKFCEQPKKCLKQQGYLIFGPQMQKLAVIQKTTTITNIT